MAPMENFPSQVLLDQAAAYVRGRPDYPPAIEGWLQQDLGLARGKAAVDLGSGTGKFLPRLRATGARVFAVEPRPAMREHLSALHPDVEARDGTAQSIPLPDASVDAVLCAQSFHLFTAPGALQEIRRVLKPGGSLGIVWNVRDARVQWVSEVKAIMAPYEDGSPDFESAAYRKWAMPTAGFHSAIERRFDNPQIGFPSIIVDRVLSVTAIARLPRAERDKVVGRLWELIASAPELAGKAQVTFPNITYAYHCRKRD
jgi:SAM-dependent methyltransferase